MNEVAKDGRLEDLLSIFLGVLLCLEKNEFKIAQLHSEYWKIYYACAAHSLGFL